MLFKNFCTFKLIYGYKTETVAIYIEGALFDRIAK